MSSFYLSVSPCHSLFTASWNVATSQPRHGVLSACSWCQRAWGVNPAGNGGPGGQDFSAKISANFINIYPLKKPKSSPVWHGPPSSCLPFEHSSTKMGSLDIDPVYSTLCPSITSRCSTPKFCFNTFQYSIGGAIMPDAITYGQDCMKPYL